MGEWMNKEKQTPFFDNIFTFEKFRLCHRLQREISFVLFHCQVLQKSRSRRLTYFYQICSQPFYLNYLNIRSKRADASTKKV